MTHLTQERPDVRRSRSLAAAAALLAGLLLTLVPAGAANAVEGPVLLSTLGRCYPANNGAAPIGVHPPQLRPMPSTVPVYVGGESQAIRYQPYLQSWNGSAWVTILAGPVFSGVTSTFTTTYNGSTGGYWQPSVAAQRTSKLYYRVAAQIWWVGDATHASAYSNRVAAHQQYSNIYGWQNVSYCTY